MTHVWNLLPCMNLCLILSALKLHCITRLVGTPDECVIVAVLSPPAAQGYQGGHSREISCAIWTCPFWRCP